MVVKLFIFFISISIQAFCQKQDTNHDKHVELFLKNNLRTHLNILGNDSLQGRGTGSLGEKKVAQYLIQKFRELGLQPFPSDGSYFQYIPLHGSYPLQKTDLKIHFANQEISLTLNEDYVLYTSGEQTFLPGKYPLAFVGYGITAPEYDYNDYQNIDIQGKVAVFLEGEPYSDNDDYFEGEKNTIYSYPESKQRIALSCGAVGSILIPFPPKEVEKEWLKTMNEFSFENVTLASSVNNNLAILINPISANILFENSLYDLNEAYQMHKENNVKSFSLNCTLSFKGYFVERDFLSPNIIGMLQGTDDKLKDSYLIISAHYDHLGIGPAINGDSIYNGVLDNAIGAAGLLELARIFSNEKQNLKRSIIFLLVTAEEKGLIGSYYYTNSPLVPLYKTIANINIDGIAVFDRFKSIIGIGAEYSTLGKIFERVVSKLNLRTSHIPEGFEKWKSYYQSDQAAFAQAGIPSMMIYEAVDPENKSFDEALHWYINYSENIYHSPSDDLNQEIDFDASVQHLIFLYNFIYEVINDPEEPAWYDGSPFLNTRLRSIAERK